jgi:ABC-type nickel/cobalt efflux system permease component RcnA
MLLSFASAMVGSAVAVLFILFAASVLRLTGTVMGNAAAWLDNGSYAMVSLLGLWLLIRQIFGLGHHHHEAAGGETPRHDDHADHRRAHRLLFADDALAPAPAESHDHAGLDTGHAPRHAAPVPSLLARAFETSSKGSAVPGPAFAYAATPVRSPGFDAVHDREPDHGHAHARHHDHHHGHGEAHSHVAVVPAQFRTGGWRETVGIVLAVGLRPCSGALIVMVFALSQGVLWAGIAAVFLMGVGTAITVATLATLAMFAKGMARRLSGRRQTVALRLVWWAELGGALFVFVFGIVLILANLYG